MAKSKRKRPVVKGPQLVSRILAGKRPSKSLGKSKGEPHRAMRLRYAEPPAKRRGNPFIAFRIPAAMLEAFERDCSKRKTSPAARVRGYIAKVTGISEVGQDAE